jgi:hypothetical protein
VDCFEGKFKVNMRLANQKENVKCVDVAFLLALAKYRRNSGVVSSDEKYIHRAHTKQTARSLM